MAMEVRLGKFWVVGLLTLRWANLNIAWSRIWLWVSLYLLFVVVVEGFSGGGDG